MNLIVAVDKNWAIGNKGKLLNSIPEDMRFFRETTTGGTVIMGQKTYESFPGPAPLRDRVNIIISDDMSYKVDGATVVHSVEDALKEAEKYEDENTFVIGGGSIYKAMLPYCNIAHITKMDHAYDADTWIPNLDEMPEWKVAAESDLMTYFNIPYKFVLYVREGHEDKARKILKEQ